MHATYHTICAEVLTATRNIDRDEPPSRALTREAHSEPLHQRDRDQRHEREDDEYRDNQQRHTSAKRHRQNRQLV
jgi:hypothetical protein